VAKNNYLFDHLFNPAFKDRMSLIQLKGNAHRLSFGFGRSMGGWRKVAEIIESAAGHRLRWFPDANVAFLPDTQPVWDAFRLAGLGIPGGVATLTEAALSEMEVWLENPYHHPDRAQAIKAAVDRRSWLNIAGVRRDSPYALAIQGYVHLLGLRRHLAVPMADGSTWVGTTAADKVGTMNVINKIGQRALGLAKKGRVDAEKTGAANVNDERHCLTVIATALKYGVDSYILTSDQDHMEIFYKTQWLIDTHYRAWLAAKLVRDGYYGPPARQLTETNGYFGGPLQLYRRTTTHLQEVLPALYDPIHVGVLYVEPSGGVQKIVFPFERQMLGLFKTRSETNGRSTDLFGPANIHVELGPLKIKLDDLYLGIGVDLGRPIQTNGITTFLSRVDHDLACHCQERGTLLWGGPPAHPVRQLHLK
jgi:hypothetical protein